MGVDTDFLNTEILFLVTKPGKYLAAKITKKYLELHKKYKSVTSADDWKIEPDINSDEEYDEDDNLIATVNDKSHRGSAVDFVVNLLLLLKAAKHYGVIPLSGTLSYRTLWGGASSGILYIDDTKIKLVEINDDDSGKIRKKTFTLDDVENIKNGSLEDLYV